jgi:hypothetical protein
MSNPHACGKYWPVADHPPDCPARQELDALRERVAELEQHVHDLCLERGALTMERDRLRKALEDAPPFGQGGYFQWYVTTRREALDG